MNQLIIQQKPEFGFILEEHQEEFVQRVLDAYERNRDTQGPPSITDNIFYHVLMNRSEPFVAGMLAKEHKDDLFFQQQVAGMSKSERYRYVKDIADDYNMMEDYAYDAWFYEDIRRVLMFNQMSFGDVFDITAEQIVHNEIYYCNMPTVKVW